MKRKVGPGGYTADPFKYLPMLNVNVNVNLLKS